MTTNQLILLLQFYRGTVDEEFKIGTFEQDIQYLSDNDYISMDHNFDVRLSQKSLKLISNMKALLYHPNNTMNN